MGSASDYSSNALTADDLNAFTTGVSELSATDPAAAVNLTTAISDAGIAFSNQPLQTLEKTASDVIQNPLGVSSTSLLSGSAIVIIVLILVFLILGKVDSL